MFKKRNNKGFTLIELLVVIAIIGILSSVVLSSLNVARQKARVSKRISDLRQVKTALEIYYVANGVYPTTVGDSFSVDCPTIGTVDTIPGLAPTYIPVIPKDPTGNNGGIDENCYIYISDGKDYKFYDYNLTDMSVKDIQNNPTYRDPARGPIFPLCPIIDNALSLAVYTPGGQCW